MYTRRFSYLPANLHTQIFPVATWVRSPSHNRPCYGSARIQDTAPALNVPMGEVAHQPQARQAAVNAPTVELRSAG